MSILFCLFSFDQRSALLTNTMVASTFVSVAMEDDDTSDGEVSNVAESATNVDGADQMDTGPSLFLVATSQSHRCFDL